MNSITDNMAGPAVTGAEGGGADAVQACLSAFGDGLANGQPGRDRGGARRGDREDSLGIRYLASTAGINFQEGLGPHATPLIVGNRIYAASSRHELFALDKATGRRIWSHDFIKEDRGAADGTRFQRKPALLQRHGHRDNRGPGQVVGAFHQETGALVWKSGSFEYATGIAHPHLRRRPDPTGRLRRRSRRRHGPVVRTDAVEPSAQDRGWWRPVSPRRPLRA